MILVSFSIALIAIVFGAKLLAQSQKDSLGALYKYLSWFIMIMGFLVLLCDGARGFLSMCHRGEARMMNKEMMMERGDEGMMGDHSMWMMHHHRMCCGENNSCAGMMNCHEGCDEGMMNCKDGSCKDGEMAGACKEQGMSGCPMMGGMKDKKDSVKAKK